MACEHKTFSCFNLIRALLHQLNKVSLGQKDEYFTRSDNTFFYLKKM